MRLSTTTESFLLVETSAIASLRALIERPDEFVLFVGELLLELQRDPLFVGVGLGTAHRSGKLRVELRFVHRELLVRADEGREIAQRRLVDKADVGQVGCNRSRSDRGAQAEYESEGREEASFHKCSLCRAVRSFDRFQN